MSRDVRDQTLADYVVIAISPALIMTLVGSLVYFLLEVVYQGEFQGRMRWILFFFVFGSVLVARVAMQTEIAARAPLYSLVLAVATWVGLGLFVEYPPELVGISWLINLGLVGLVWWCAQKLTWDCTFIDDKVDAGKAGLLQETGLEKKPKTEEPSPSEEDDDKLNWWERFRRFREEQRKKHTPGTWVVYFSLAAVPLFGLGQSLIPAEEEDRRRYTFLLMAVYVASGLGLLLTTCFLGLRRYLRQRKVQMPVAMTGTWLTTGGVLIAALLLGGAVLPRPSSETPLFEFDPLGSKKREASDYAMMKDGSAKEKGQPGDAGQEKDGPAQKKDGQPKDSGGNRKGQGGDQKDKGSANQKDGDKGGQKDKQDSNGKKGEQKKDKNDQGKKQDDGGGSSDQDKKSESNKGKKDRQKGDGSQTYRPSKSFFKHFDRLNSIGPILKWIVFGVLAAVLVFALLRSGLQWLANFTKWAKGLLESLRAFWARLFGGKPAEERVREESEPAEARARPPRPFHSFRNPFEDGSAERLPPDEVVRYTFVALQAWAYERELARQRDETPLEFAERVGQEVPGLEEDARRLAALYARSVYARGTLPASSLGAVRQFWEKLDQVVEQPMSA